MATSAMICTSQSLYALNTRGFLIVPSLCLLSGTENKEESVVQSANLILTIRLQIDC